MQDMERRIRTDFASTPAHKTNDEVAPRNGAFTQIASSSPPRPNTTSESAPLVRENPSSNLSANNADLIKLQTQLSTQAFELEDARADLAEKEHALESIQASLKSLAQSIEQFDSQNLEICATNRGGSSVVRNRDGVSPSFSSKNTPRSQFLLFSVTRELVRSKLTEANVTVRLWLCRLYLCSMYIVSHCGASFLFSSCVAWSNSENELVDENWVSRIFRVG